jgi:hypothetical protein
MGSRSAFQRADRVRSESRAGGEFFLGQTRTLTAGAKLLSKPVMPTVQVPRHTFTLSGWAAWRVRSVPDALSRSVDPRANCATTVRELSVESTAPIDQAGSMPADPDSRLSAGVRLPPHWRHPQRVELKTGHHLRPIRATDVDLHMQAVMGSQERLWSPYGSGWRWPPETLTALQDRDDLARLEHEMQSQRSFCYALFDLGETELLGCVHIDLSPPGGAEISWWVVDWLVDGPIEYALDHFVPAWIAADWPVSVTSARREVSA